MRVALTVGLGLTTLIVISEAWRAPIARSRSAIVDAYIHIGGAATACVLLISLFVAALSHVVFRIQRRRENGYFDDRTGRKR